MIVFLNFNFLFFILCFPYFILFFYPYFLLFFPLFFYSTHVPLIFFSLFPSFLIFPTTSSTYVPLTFFFFSFFHLFPYHITLQNIPHNLRPSLIPQSLCISLFFFYSLKATTKRDDDDDGDDDEGLKHKEISHLSP